MLTYPSLSLPENSSSFVAIAPPESQYSVPIVNANHKSNLKPNVGDVVTTSQEIWPTPLERLLITQSIFQRVDEEFPGLFGNQKQKNTDDVLINRFSNGKT